MDHFILGEAIHEEIGMIFYFVLIVDIVFSCLFDSNQLQKWQYITYKFKLIMLDEQQNEFYFDFVLLFLNRTKLPMDCDILRVVYMKCLTSFAVKINLMKIDAVNAKIPCARIRVFLIKCFVNGVGTKLCLVAIYKVRF